MVAKRKKDKVTHPEIDQIKSLAEASEAYLVGILWSNIVKYYEYAEKINYKDFLHKNWAFMFQLGKRIIEDGAKQLDDITVNIFLEEKGIEKDFEKNGGWEVLTDLMSIVQAGEMNAELYFEKLMKNRLIINLFELYGEKVVTDTEKYSFKDMTVDELTAYWQAKSSLATLNLGKSYATEDLYVDGEQFLQDLESDNSELLPFYSSYYLNNVVQGIPRGEVTIVGGFGNSGKSSFIIDKILMSMLKSGDKTLIVLNEEPAKAFRNRLILSILNHEMKEELQAIDAKGFSRKKMLSPQSLSEDERELLIKGWEKYKELTDGDESKIKVVYMEQYKITELKDIIRFYATQGYVNLIVDTHKVPDGYRENTRWEAFVESTKEIYKMTRAEAGGFNLRTVLSIQLADAYVSHKFLSFDAIGEGKAMKNEASTLLMFRPFFADEYEKLEVYRWVRGLGKQPTKEIVQLDEDKTYYVLFIPKNRQGANTDTGQDCIILQPNFNYNSFYEIGYAKIHRSF